MSEKLNQKKEDFSSALLIIENMIESDNEKIKRFKFSPKEHSALLFTTEILALYLSEFKNM